MWLIISSVLNGMSKWNWLMSAVQVYLSVSATLATGGWALAAKTTGVVLSTKSLIDEVKDLS